MKQVIPLSEHPIRPWKPEEVPIGALFKSQHDDHNRTEEIVAVHKCKIINRYKLITFYTHDYKDIYSSHYLCDLVTSIFDYVYSVDEGVTWQRCGVPKQ